MTGTILSNKSLLTGTIPVNNCFLICACAEGVPRLPIAPAVHPGITIWVDKIEIEIFLGGRAIFLKFLKSIFLLLDEIEIEKKGGFFGGGRVKFFFEIFKSTFLFLDEIKFDGGNLFFYPIFFA